MHPTCTTGSSTGAYHFPMHHSWAEWLWERGIEQKEITPLECNGIHAWRCIPNEAKLRQDLSEAVRYRQIIL